MKIPLKEPLSPRYISINPLTNKVHLMVPLVGGQEVSTDNSYRATVALKAFFEGGAIDELSAYKHALALDISLLPVGDYERAKKEGRLSQIVAYIEAISAMRQDYMDSINAFLATPSNLYSIQLRPRDQVSLSKVINPVFTLNRQNDGFGTPLSALYNKLHSVDIKPVSAKDKLISAAQSQLHGVFSFEDIQNALRTQALRLFGMEIDFSHDGDGNPVTQDYIDELFMLDEGESLNVIGYMNGLLRACALDIWDTLPAPPFYSIPQSAPADERTEALSILVQFFLANLNVYCKSRGISDKNVGVVLDEAPELSHELVESIALALNLGDDVERVVYNFFNMHGEEFGSSRALTEEDLQAIRDKFERTYRTVTAANEYLRMDDFMILDIDAQGDSAKVVTHQGHLCVNFAEIVSELAASANPDFFQSLKEDFTGHPITIPHKNEHVAGDVDVDIDRIDIASLGQIISEEELAWFPQPFIDACRAHPSYQFRHFLEDVATGKQEEAEALLTATPANTQTFLRTPGVFTDYSGRTFNCTAYEYAYWAKDTHMCRMLESHMDEETKAQMLARIDAIEAEGLSYQQNGVAHCSAHFDFTPLIEAYVYFFVTLSMQSPEALHDAWRAVGKAQRNVPAHVAQEYCRPYRSFDPTPEFNEATLPRVLTFCNSVTNNRYIPYIDDSWFPLAASNSGLGFDFALSRAPEKVWGSKGSVPAVYRSHARTDLAAVRRLDEVRTADLKQSRENLKPPGPSHPMTL